MKASKKVQKKSQKTGPPRQSNCLHKEQAICAKMIKAGHNPTQVQLEIRGARRSGIIDEEQKKAIEAVMMEDTADNESDAVVPDSDPKEGLLSLDTQTRGVLQDFREMFEGTQPSFMQDTQMGNAQLEDEQEGYASEAVSSVQIRSEESGSDESGGYEDTDLGDLDKENQGPVATSTQPTTPVQTPMIQLPNSPLKQHNRHCHLQSQGGISALETDSDNLTDICEHPAASKITQAFGILEEEQKWHKRTLDQLLRARRNCNRKTRRIKKLKKKLDEKEKVLKAKDRELEEYKKEFAVPVMVAFMDKYRAKSVEN